MLTRRELLTRIGQGYLASQIAPITSSFMSLEGSKAMRCINIVNFIRGVEPRFQTDLLLPVQRQMELIKAHRFPATWLLQFDALVSGPFVDFLKANMVRNQEVGIWFEMNEMHCKAAGVEWRGRSGYEWDHLPYVAFTIGYTKEERVKLADAFMTEFKRVWGHYPKSVASWNLDAWTMAHLTETYGIDAYAVCRDQIATDGFTIWGAPIAGYYPSKLNCWSPAIETRQQIDTPVFRMLGQDPVYYYNKRWKMPSGDLAEFPDTMEPVWPSGQNPTFVREFLRMIATAPALEFAYLQMGQENSFPWQDQSAGYPMQMNALSDLKGTTLETMGETGRRFKRVFKSTPVQAQVQLSDPYGNTEAPQLSVWYQSRFYRAKVHVKDGYPYLRDLTIYRDDFAQPFLLEPTRESFVEQRMLALLDGYHWSEDPGSLTASPAGAHFKVEGLPAKLKGRPKVVEHASALSIMMELQEGGELHLIFEENKISVLADSEVSLTFQWDPKRSSFAGTDGDFANYRYGSQQYALKALAGTLSETKSGFVITDSSSIVLCPNPSYS